MAGGVNPGTLTLTRSVVSGNTTIGDGGGADVALGGTLYVYDGSQITGNTAGLAGGGIANGEGTVHLQTGVSISNNTSAQPGGGISLSTNLAQLYLNGAQIGVEVAGNQPDDLDPGTGTVNP